MNMKHDGSGDGPSSASASGRNNGGSSAMKIDSSNSSSPLQIFVQAKKCINDIFPEFEEYIKETCVFVQGNFTNKEKIQQKKKPKSFVNYIWKFWI